MAGRRVKKTVYGSPDVVTKYAYDGSQVIAEYEDGSLVRKFVYGPGIDEPICMIDVANGNAVYYYHFDGLGSVVALSNNSGEVIERYSHDVFGEPNRVSDVNNPYLFTGRRFDDETGLYYYRARYYSPEIGRFLQTDPLRYTKGLNLYTYCGNNPINLVDPWGLDWYPPEWAVGIVETTGDIAGWIYDQGMSVWDTTTGIRGPVGAVTFGTGTSLLAVGCLASNPPGWVVGAGLVLAEVGVILTVSDLDVWGTAENIVEPLEREGPPVRNRLIDDLLDKGLDGLKEKDS